MAVATIAVNDASPSARLAMRTRRMLPPSRMPPTRAESPPSHTLTGRVKPPHAPETREPGACGPRLPSVPSSDVPLYRPALTFAFTTSIRQGHGGAVSGRLWTAPMLAVGLTLTTPLIDGAVPPASRFWNWYGPLTACFVTSFLPG